MRTDYWAPVHGIGPLQQGLGTLLAVARGAGAAWRRQRWAARAVHIRVGVAGTYACLGAPQGLKPAEHG
eukprot:5107667-Alexandrium_andersonii.AAC.1